MEDRGWFQTSTCNFFGVMPAKKRVTTLLKRRESGLQIGFGDSDVGHRAIGLGFGFRVWGWGLGLRMLVSGLRLWTQGFRYQGVRFLIWC